MKLNVSIPFRGLPPLQHPGKLPGGRKVKQYQSPFEVCRLCNVYAHRYRLSREVWYQSPFEVYRLCNQPEQSLFRRRCAVSIPFRGLPPLQRGRRRPIQLLRQVSIPFRGLPPLQPGAALGLRVLGDGYQSPFEVCRHCNFVFVVSPFVSAMYQSPFEVYRLCNLVDRGLDGKEKEYQSPFEVYRLCNLGAVVVGGLLFIVSIPFRGLPPLQLHL